MAETGHDTPKSARTRTRILGCALALFAEIGYAEATNARIAEAAGLTRGAMLYHFPTRESLVEAAAAYIAGERAAMMAAASARPHDGVDLVSRAIDVYWELLHTPVFLAFAELEAAARTDAAVDAAVSPHREAFDRGEAGGNMLGLFSAGAGARLDASRDLSRFLLEGLARARLTYDSEARIERLLAVIKRAAHMLNRKGSYADLWPDDANLR